MLLCRKGSPKKKKKGSDALYIVEEKSMGKSYLQVGKFEF
jgi:hypothetical protein